MTELAAASAVAPAGRAFNPWPAVILVVLTCLAVLFVPSLFVVVQKFEEWRAARKGAAKAQAHQLG